MWQLVGDVPACMACLRVGLKRIFFINAFCAWVYEKGVPAGTLFALTNAYVLLVFV